MSPATARIPLGRLAMTAGVAGLISERRWLAAALPIWLGRHARNDCPNLDAHDRTANAWAMQADERVLTSWPIGPADAGLCLWIITEADRSATTILLPDEY